MAVKTRKSAPLTDQLRCAVQRGDLSLPPLPELAHRALHLLDDPDSADQRRLVELIECDAAIAAGTLRAANSSSFGGLREINTVEPAVQRLGLRQVAAIITALVQKGQFVTGLAERRGLLQALWNHAMASAFAARRLAVLAEGEEHQAFLGGLFHDVGKLLVLKGVESIEARTPGLVTTGQVLGELMTVLHAELGGQILAAWSIPEPLCAVARDHHLEPRADRPLLLLVQAANAIARKMGAHPEPVPDLVLIEEPAVELLGLRELDLAEVMVDLEDEIACVQGIL